MTVLTDSMVVGSKFLLEMVRTEDNSSFSGDALEQVRGRDQSTESHA